MPILAGERNHELTASHMADPVDRIEKFDQFKLILITWSDQLYTNLICLTWCDQLD